MVTADFLSQSVYDTKEKEFERKWEKVGATGFESATSSSQIESNF